MEADRKIDYRSQSDELMQLIVQGVESDIERNDQEVVSTAVTGWDDRLHSPKEHHGLKIKGIEQFGLTHLEPYLPNTPPSPEERSRHQDPSTQISEDMTVASYQFSEMCFSIDLLKSYPSADHYPYSTNMEARSQYIKMFLKLRQISSQTMWQCHKESNNSIILIYQRLIPFIEVRI